MNASLVELFSADAAEAISRRRDDTQLAIARQRDTAQHGLKVVESVAAYELLTSNDPLMAILSKLADRTPSPPAPAIDANK
jgi:hypothetical protein